MSRMIGRVISTVGSAAIGVAAGSAAVKFSENKKVVEKQEQLRKLHVLYMAFDQWLQIRQAGKSLAEYFVKNNYKTVAVYGMKELGERLCDELKGSEITVCYAIDKNADQIYADVDVVTPDDDLMPVDVIVVTAIYYFDEIEEMMCKKVECPIVSLEDILYEM